MYQQAPQIISSTDNYDSDKIYRSTSRNKHLDEVEEDSDSIVVDQHVDYTNKINNNDIYTRTEEENVDTSNQEDIYVEKTQLVDGQYSNEDLRLVYEQAIYNMFENRYTEAAKLFKKIIDIQPTNKAAKIRLRECMEKQPTTSENKDPKEKTKEMLSEIDGLTEDTDQEISTETDIDESENTYELDETLTEPINNFTEDIRGMTLDEGDNSIMLDQYGNKINTETYKNADSTVNQYTSEELRVVYEQAIYYMSDNKYNEAAKLFKKIIDIQPTNKAAKIRLKECIEKQPTILSETETIADSDLESVVKQKQIDTEESSNTDNLEKPEDGTEITAETADKPNDFVEDIKRLQRRDSIKQKYTDEELQKMYEEAIYTMFQNNYSEAAKIFHQILRIRPENKAARIRLQECKEASGNA